MLRRNRATRPSPGDLPAAPATAFFGLSLSAVALCIALWIRAKTIGEDERGNAERRALFVGLWPPLLWSIGESLRRRA